MSAATGDRDTGRPSLTTLLRLAATGGRVDGLRIALTAMGSAAAGIVLLLAAAVVSIGPHDGPYRLDVLQQSGLRPGVVVVLVLLALPILSFAAQCSRIGAPARDRRLAAFRMAGGTPSDVRRIVALETGVASLLGSLLGGLCWFVAHLGWGAPSAHPGTAAAHRTTDGVVVTRVHAPDGRLLPLDVVPHSWMIVVALLLVPTAAAVGAVLALRRAAITPFGVIHRTDRRPPNLTPAILFLVGTAGLAAWQGIFAALPDAWQRATWLMPLATLALFLFALVGLVLASASIAHRLGLVIAARTGRPALLIAARRMADSPYTSSRAATAVTLVVLLGAGVLGARAAILAVTSDYDDPFYAHTFDLLQTILTVAVILAVAGLLVVTAEGVVSRRRTLAALRAAGTSRRTLAAATLWETALPLTPTVLLATVAGILAARGMFGTTVGSDGPMEGSIPVPVPWSGLTVLAGGTMLAALLMTALSLVLLPRSTDVTELRAAA